MFTMSKSIKRPELTVFLCPQRKPNPSPSLWARKWTEYSFFKIKPVSFPVCPIVWAFNEITGKRQIDNMNNAAYSFIDNAPKTCTGRCFYAFVVSTTGVLSALPLWYAGHVWWDLQLENKTIIKETTNATAISFFMIIDFKRSKLINLFFSSKFRNVKVEKSPTLNLPLLNKKT